MDVLIDNINFLDYGITVIDYTGVLSFPKEREDEREWADKSGVDKNLENIRYDSKEFILKCLVKSTTEAHAYNLVKSLVDYMFNRGCFVLSIRDSARGIREMFLCERSSTIIPDINIRQQNSLYYFKLGLKDVNPNALKYKNTITASETSIVYTKGQTAILYWGNGDREIIKNSATYTKSDYLSDGLVDIIIDIDSNTDDIVALSAEFSADVTSGIKVQEVQFTDESVGDIIIWAWNFGDGTTSAEQNPRHSYTESGTYTVTLQVFNTVAGSDIETKINYITVRNARMLVNLAGDLALVNLTGDLGLIN